MELSCVVRDRLTKSGRLMKTATPDGEMKRQYLASFRFLKKALAAAHELRRPYQDTITFERNCRNLSAEAQNLAQKAAELLALDKELGDA